MRKTTTGGPVRGLQVGRVLGTPVVLTWSWFLVAGVVTVLYAPLVQRRIPELGAGSYAVAFASAVLLLLSVFLHELAHAVAARAVGTAPTHIALDVWGGHTAFAGEFASPYRSAVVAVVGPATNGALAALGWAVHPAADPDGVSALLLYAFVFTNAFVAVFNALPGLPLDGGRVLEAVVWRVSGSRADGTLAAGWVGRAVALGLIAWLVGRAYQQWRPPEPMTTLWLVLVAWLLWQGATQAIRVGQWRRRVAGLVARELLRPAVSVPQTCPLIEAVAAGASSPPQEVVLLDARARPVAVLDRARLDRLTPAQLATTSTDDIARALAPEAVLDVDLAGESLIETMQRAPHPEYAVLSAAGLVVGLLAWHDVTGDLTAR